MKQIIHYFRRQNYGNLHFYLAKKSDREAFRMLTGRKTISKLEMIAITNLSKGELAFQETFEADTDRVDAI